MDCGAKIIIIIIDIFLAPWITALYNEKWLKNTI